MKQKLHSMQSMPKNVKSKYHYLVSTLVVILMFLSNISLAQVSGDFRSKASGNWNATGTWETFNGSSWANAGGTPGSTTTVYVQTAHVVTLTQNESCGDLHIATGTTVASSTLLGKIALVSFTLNVNGKMRCYFATLNTIPGTTSSSGYSIYPFTITSGGKVSLVGSNRTVFNTGEWGATITTGSTGAFPLEVNMTAGQTATFATNIKASSFNLVSGTVTSSTGTISTDNGTAGQGNVTIGTGTTLISAVSGGSVFQKSASVLAGTLTIQSGATLELTGTTPTISMTTISNSGTVIYSKGGAQTLLAAVNSGASMNSYKNLTISGSGAKTTPASLAINVTDTIKNSGTASSCVMVLGASGSLTYSATTGTYVFNNTSSSASIVSASPEWPASSGPTNILVTASTLQFTASGAISRTIPSGGTFTLNGGHFTLNTSNTLTFSNNTTINRLTNNDFNTSSGTYNIGSLSTDVITINVGSATAPTGITMNNSSEMASTPTANLNVNIFSGFTLNLTSNSKTFNNLTLNGVLTDDGTSGRLLTVKGNITGSGSQTTTNNGKVVMSGNNVASNISGISFANLDLNDADAFTLTGSPTVSGTLTLTAGALTMTGQSLTIGASGTVNRIAGSLGSAPVYGSGTSVTYSGTGATSGNELAPSSGSIGTLTTAGSGTYTLANAVSIANLTLTSGTLADGGFTITNSGNILGTATHSGAGKISMTGTSKTISAVTLGNLERTGTDTIFSSATTLNSLSVLSGKFSNQTSTTIAGDLIVSGSGSLVLDNTASGRSISVSGNLSLSGSGGLSPLLTGNSFNMNLLGVGKTITNTASANNFSKTNIRFNSGATYTLASNFTYTSAISSRRFETTSGSGSLDIDQYTLDMGQAYLAPTTVVNSNSSGVIKTAYIRTSAQTAIPTGQTWAGTIEYNASTGAQFVVAGTYNNLKISNSSAIDTAESALSVNGDLTLASGSTFSDGGFIITLSGNILGSGTHIGTGKISMTGTSKSIAGVTLQNLELNNAAGFSLSGNANINGTLILTNGILTTSSSNLLAINSTGSIASASSSSYISGPLARAITTANYFGGISYPIGKGGNYRPVTFTYAADPTSKTVTMEQFESIYPGTIPSTATVSRFGTRYRTITQSATGIAYTVGLNDGGVTPTGTVVMLRREGTGSTTSNATSFGSSTYTNTSSFSTTNVANDIALAETAIPLTVTGATTSNKAYDGTNTASVTGGSLSAGVISPDVVTLNQSGTFAQTAVGTSIAITGTCSLSGANAGAYSLTQPTLTSRDITAVALTITANNVNKTYGALLTGGSGSTAYTLTSGTLQNSETVSSVTIAYGSGAAANATPATYTGSVTPSAAVGANGFSASNYNITYTPGNIIVSYGSTPNLWVGVTNNDYNTAGNWQDGNVPTGTPSITVNSSANNPTLSGNLTVNNITLNDTLVLGGYKLTINGTISGTNTVLSGSNASALEYTGSGSTTLTFDQTTDGNITNPTSGTNALKDIVTSGTGTLTLANKVNLFERLSVGSGTTFNTGDSLVLRSIAGSNGNNTAYVDQVAGTISGQVRVERYIHAQSRGWRAFTSPVTYTGQTAGTVANNWQNSWGLSANYGTRITGPSATNGLDDVSVSASLMKYNSTSGAWTNITNTTTETIAGTSGSADNKSFFLFVRGDRTVTPNGYNPLSFQATTISARGKLQTGTQVFNFTGAANKAWLVGNPYACPVDMSTVTFSSNIPNQVYVWDPNRPSSYSDVTGAYVTFDRTTWGAPTAGSTTQYFQTGQCFFVVPTSASGVSVTFNESNKSASNQNNQTSGTGNGLSDIFNVKLNYVRADGSKAEIDGIRAKFGANYSAAVTAEDAYKWATAGIENMSLKRGSSLLSIEARPHITTTDTLFFNATNLSIGANYEFKLNPINFDASVSSCKLVDKFLNTETPISLTNTSLVNFNVSSVAGSNAANRFYVVFNAAGSLPTSNSLTVKAYKQNNNSIKIDWEAIAENNVKTYTVEKSTDAASFSKLSEATAKNGNTTNVYSIVDNNPIIGVNYYRIQSVQTNNNKAYSTIVRVEMSDKGIKSITVYPNPVKSSANTIGLQMNNLTAGSYTAVLYNTAGQQVWMNTMNHNGSNGSSSLQLNKTLASGTYQLQLTDSKGNSYKQTVLVVE